MATGAFPYGLSEKPKNPPFYDPILSAYDNEIEKLEKALSRLQEVRREHINRNNLNKV